MFRLWIWVSVLFVVVVLACKPAATPAPTQPQSPPALTQAAPAVVAQPSTSPEDEAWAKVVQAAQKEGVVVLYTFALAGDVGNAVSKAFRDKYGVKAEVIGGTSPVMLARVKAEYSAGQYIADIADFSAGRALELKDAKMTVSNKDIPALRDRGAWNIHPLDMDPEGHLFSYYGTVLGPWVNTRLVKPDEEPKSWQEFLEPKWKGKLIIGDPGVYIGTEIFYYAMVIKEKRLTEDYFRRLAPQIKKYEAGGAREQVASLARGEGHVSLTASPSGGTSLIAEGAPIKAIEMKEGLVSTASTVSAQLSKAPHPNAARLFLNWFLSAEGLATWAKAASQSTYRKDVPDFFPAAARVSPANQVAINFADYEKVNERYNQGALVRLLKGEAGK